MTSSLGPDNNVVFIRPQLVCQRLKPLSLFWGFKPKIILSNSKATLTEEENTSRQQLVQRGKKLFE